MITTVPARLLLSTRRSLFLFLNCSFNLKADSYQSITVAVGTNVTSVSVSRLVLTRLTNQLWLSVCPLCPLSGLHRPRQYTARPPGQYCILQQ